MGEKVIRMRDTKSAESTNLYFGKIFILRNEPWEPYLNHAARIASTFSVNLDLEISNYDDSLVSFPKSSANPVVIWINWNRILNRELYIKELSFFSNFKNKVYLVLPNSFSKDFEKLRNQVGEELPWLNLIQVSKENESTSNPDLGYSKNQILEVATFIGQNIAPFHFCPQAKAIITDLDNTLYSGILGEDLIENLKVPDDKKNLQRKLGELYENGILINIVSKNNNTEVEELFNAGDIISLPKQNFTCIVANWDSKSVGVSEVLRHINIDEESVVFLDDNPRELAELAIAFPRMLLIDAKDSEKLNRILDLKLFSSHNSNLVSSKERSADIKANERRRMLLETEETNDEVLSRIDTRIVTKLAESQKEYERAEELFKKTNQFNFSNRRTEISYDENIGSIQILLSNVSDIFSDSGIVGALNYSKKDGNILEINEFVISCRALGRGIEKYIFKSMLDVLCNRKEVDSKTEIQINFTESSRNVPAKHFLKEWFADSNELGLYKLNTSFSKQVLNIFGGS
jgi:FkbH-like protein